MRVNDDKFIIYDICENIHRLQNKSCCDIVNVSADKLGVTG